MVRWWRRLDRYDKLLAAPALLIMAAGNAIAWGTHLRQRNQFVTVSVVLSAPLIVGWVAATNLAMRRRCRQVTDEVERFLREHAEEGPTP